MQAVAYGRGNGRGCRAAMALTFKSAIDEIRDGVKPINDDRADARAPKKTVGYTNESPHADQSCALCEMYTAGRCDAVDPPDVSPRGWCELFEWEQDIDPVPTRSQMAMTGDILIDTILRMPQPKRNIDMPVFDRSQKVP